VIIRKYGIELHRLTRDDIDLIREMRNKDEIRSKMFYQAPIEKDQQEAWFCSINNMFNYYFLIHYENKKIGLIHGKNSNFERREDEGGIFIWDSALLGTGVPAKASICFIECSFQILRRDRIIAKVRKDNTAAYHYNLSLGYIPDNQNEDYLVLTRDTFEKKAPLLRQLASGMKNSTPLSINDIEIPEPLKYRHLYESLPADILDIIRPKLFIP
jgi:RimJ/RimL family protein N-acetyltransferase